ncbi:hypothetical protein POM88_034337 [Heracleum sosnowskyi]|uniref:Uncharacterized protein n=1 Tax=Heracleum sosnowskyi TaxID=360622 RepID=A0AAD8HLF2_9APIA|nr:hypothetical protein POM88_034337 [Heracleum sosnowskyi]
MKQIAGQLKGNYNFNFGPNQTPSLRITTLRDLMIGIWDYCALNPRFTVPVLALLLGLFGYQNYASDGLGGIFGSHGNSTEISSLVGKLVGVAVEWTGEVNGGRVLPCKLAE